MPILNVDDTGALGIVKDTPEYELPKNAWTGGNNVKFFDNAVEKSKGREQVFGTPTGMPYFIMPIQQGANYFWFYASLTKIYGIDGTTHYDISKTATSYQATADINWNGGVLSGGVAILNNGVDTPQQWLGPALTNICTDLSNWPSGMVARVIRPYKNYLVAADIDEGAGRNPTLLRWSHPANIGGVPSSWDYTDPTYDAGRVGLDKRGEHILDMVELKDLLYIYNENSTSLMQFTGGHNIFSFRQVFDQLGALSRRCVAPFFGRHFMLATDDVVVHDGHNVEQVLTRRWKRWLFSSIDGTNFERCFVTISYKNNEVWLCFPESGLTYPNIALIWNWRENTVTVRDLPTQTAHIAWGIVDPSADASFDGDVGTFDEATDIFDEQVYSGATRDLLLGDIKNTRLIRMDKTEQEEGVDMTAYVEREYLPLGRQDSQGNIRVNTTNVKFVKQVQPRIEGTVGGVVNVYIGYRYTITDNITWEGPVPFIIGTSRKLDFRVSGRFISIKFESTTNINWKLTGYSVEYELGGVR